MKTRTTILGAVLVLAAAATASGCTVYSDPAVAPAAPVVETYNPQYYDGNVVYYDQVGVPYVYVGHEVRYVPRGYAHYDVLVGHYRAHGPAYHAWYRNNYRARGEVRVHYRR